jgi:CDP-diacylglycerol---glycerol-3-phosphate 3-phosphatidyltransferase
VTDGTVVSEKGEPAPMGRRVGPAPLVNAANALTAARIVLIPIFVLLTIASDLTHPGLRIAACIAFFVAAVTDLVDGWIARTWDLVTSFGKVADPIADKALTGAAFLLLSAYGALPWWVTVVILAREWGVTALRFWVIRHGVIPASRGGKIKTALQTLAIVWYLWPFDSSPAQAGPWLMGAALIVTVVTGVDYVVRALRLRRGGILVHGALGHGALGHGAPGDDASGHGPSNQGVPDHGSAGGGAAGRNTSDQDQSTRDH